MASVSARPSDGMLGVMETVAAMLRSHMRSDMEAKPAPPACLLPPELAKVASRLFMESRAL